MFAFPSLYEGFGLPILEAFASGIPVLTAENSSLSEVAGDGALYCQATDTAGMATKLVQLWQDEVLRQELVARGTARLAGFSWDRCARETLNYILDKNTNLS
jgi:alpha-1,3-rhamnosyl/mannosyltransferase